ncbi:hypothetical protein JVX90_15600 [Gordonia sp. PDNC005]|uniref:hypothetical protein n=1 Tax=unclassified Gordonia (in: high G+C Gram-positive bacteria) TaxID=2657482 RepID=UPI0019667DC5|nr:hypothetical protein [Gordonia sp. PDNC005]QRY61817.1 hypothetical protein JVX90_15600 [Gordonia sp. PDNC005]
MNDNEDTRPLPEADSAPTPFAGDPGQTPHGSGKARRRTLLIGSAVVIALLTGGGVAYALSTGSDDTPVTVSDQSVADDADPDDVDDKDDESDPQQNPTTSVSALRDAARAAITATGAVGATSVDVERDGYDVEVRLSDGREQDVHVRSDGAVVQETPDRTDDPSEVLDLNRFDAVAAAATAAVGGGSMESISSSDDRGVRYDVGVRLTDGRDADVDLTDDLRVVSSDVDD